VLRRPEAGPAHAQGTRIEREVQNAWLGAAIGPIDKIINAGND
jgi:hypothetical protein